MTISDRASALAYLTQRIDYERAPAHGPREFKLERMRNILRALGDPQDGLRIVHVAGTKGKGSTSSMIASVLRAAGLRTGLYTSPHLQDLEERYNVDGESCSGDDLVELVNLVRPAVERIDQAATAAGEASQRATYFEITTAMAFLHFARCGVDAVVLEVGLGGRLDSTNVCRPQVAVITSISFDHTRQLGSTLEAICREKAGIIKPGVDVVTGVTQPELQEVIRQVADDRSCSLWRVGREFGFEYRTAAAEESAPPAGNISGPFATSLNYWDNAGAAPKQLNDLTLRLAGRHQAANAAIAVATTRRLQEQGWTIADEDIRRGLALASCPARAEIIAQRPTVLLDVAHNVASIEALTEVVEEQFAGRRRVLVFASSRDKDVAGMIRRLAPHFQHLILTRFCENPRAVSPAELVEICRGEPVASGAVIDAAESPAEAWRRVMEVTGPDDVICVAGSFFLAAEIRPLAVSPTPATGVSSLSVV